MSASYDALFLQALGLFKASRYFVHKLSYQFEKQLYGCPEETLRQIVAQPQICECLMLIHRDKDTDTQNELDKYGHSFFSDVVNMLSIADKSDVRETECFVLGVSMQRFPEIHPPADYVYPAERARQVRALFRIIQVFRKVTQQQFLKETGVQVPYIDDDELRALIFSTPDMDALAKLMEDRQIVDPMQLSKLLTQQVAEPFRGGSL